MYKNLAAAFAAACFISPVFSQTTPAAAAPLKVGFVYVTPVTDAGWVRQHENGRQAVQAALGTQVKTSFVENVPEGPDAERVIRDLALQGLEQRHEIPHGIDVVLEEYPEVFQGIESAVQTMAEEARPNRSRPLQNHAFHVHQKKKRERAIAPAIHKRSSVFRNKLPTSLTIGSRWSIQGIRISGANRSHHGQRHPRGAVASGSGQPPDPPPGPKTVR